MIKYADSRHAQHSCKQPRCTGQAPAQNIEIYEIKKVYENYKIYEYYIMDIQVSKKQWMDGWMSGWRKDLEWGKVNSKDCLQQSKEKEKQKGRKNKESKLKQKAERV